MKILIFILCLVVASAIITLSAKMLIKSLCKNAIEFNDNKRYKVGNTWYHTEVGAKTRCEYLFKRHAVNAEVTIKSDYEPTIKCRDLDIWKLTR